MKHINSKEDLKDFLKYESKKYNLKKASYPFFALREEKILYKFNYLLRNLEYSINCNKKLRRLFVRLLYLRLERKYSMFIPINVFDKGLRLIHIGPRLVNGKSAVGKNFIMHASTNIVAGGVNDCAPRIGNNCIMSVGSIILGDAVLGDNTVVGAGAVVTRNFGDGNMTVAGVPAKKISDKTGEDWPAKKAR